ncbi:site-specific integrase [Sporosarcina sp. USHLN248]|uniref:site-specific integrase n=1 Tax=Sporosarcina sp. USHLN248 TaxID=3081300 RepID=UPI00301617BD
MKFVEPIRDLNKISSMKKILFAQSERNYLLFTIGINSPYRISDLIRIQFKHILDHKNSVRSHLILIEQKTGKENKVALSKGVKKAIEAYASQYYEGDPEAYLFRSRKGTNQAISRVQAWTIISDAAKELGIENIGTHSLRKTFGYHQIKRGTNITLLMKMFNHSSESVTLRYIGITQDDMDAAIQALDL